MSEMTPKERAMKEAIRIVANPQRSAHAAADIIEAAITEAVSAAKAEMELQVVEMRERCARAAKSYADTMRRQPAEMAMAQHADRIEEIIRALPIPTIEAVEVVGQLMEANSELLRILFAPPGLASPHYEAARRCEDVLAAARKKFGGG